MRVTVPWRLWTGRLLFAAAAVIVIFTTNVFQVAFGSDFYRTQYEALDLGQSSGMSQRTYLEVNRQLGDYFLGRRNQVQIEAEMDGEVQPLFRERERRHLVDVRDLFQLAQTVRWISAGVALLLLVVPFLWSVHPLSVIGDRLLWALYVPIAVFAVVGVLALIDFHQFWTQFHHLFFTNDLWMLDPENDTLLKMFPEPFFFAATREVVTHSGLEVLALGVAGWGLQRIGDQRMDDQA